LKSGDKQTLAGLFQFKNYRSSFVLGLAEPDLDPVPCGLVNITGSIPMNTASGLSSVERVEYLLKKAVLSQGNRAMPQLFLSV